MRAPSRRFFRPFFGFTLVELIVVIAVLAVLATIAFSTVQNVSSSARDSARLTDVSSMKTSLETYGATKGALPIPDNATVITWSGASAWSQGAFGDNTARQLGNISKPKDPLYSVEYTYSLANNKREYELATVLEKATSLAPFSKAYAAGESYDPTIKGNYNGIAIKTQSGSAIWILTVPTIIAGDVKDGNLLNTVLSFPKSGNIPASYVGKVTSTQPVVSFSASQVWNSSALPKTDSEYSALTTALQNAYSGNTLVNNNNTLKSLLATTDTATYGKNLIGNLAGTTPPTNQNITCKTLRDAGNTADGVYTIRPNGTPLQAYCDMTTDGGGWTRIFYQNYTTSIDTTSVNLLASTRPYAFSYNSYEELPASNIAFSDVLVDMKTSSQLLYKMSNVPQSVKNVFSLGTIPNGLAFVTVNSFSANTTNLLTSAVYPAASIDFYNN